MAEGRQGHGAADPFDGIGTGFGAALSVILAALAAWLPVSDKSGLPELGWRGALCMAPLLFLGRDVIRGMSRSGGGARVVDAVPGAPVMLE